MRVAVKDAVGDEAVERDGDGEERLSKLLVAFFYWACYIFFKSYGPVTFFKDYIQMKRNWYLVGMHK